MQCLVFLAEPGQAGNTVVSTRLLAFHLLHSKVTVTTHACQTITVSGLVLQMAARFQTLAFQTTSQVLNSAVTFGSMYHRHVVYTLHLEGQQTNKNQTKQQCHRPD